MLCLRLTLMRDVDTGIVSEPAALVGLDPEAMNLNRQIQQREMNYARRVRALEPVNLEQK
jgi:hypothetical protein